MSTSSTTLDPGIIRELRRLLPHDAVLEGRDRLLVYESDGLTAYRSAPGAVVLPRTTEEVSRVLAFLHRQGVAVVPRGAGTGLSGGALATEGSVVVATPRMNQILQIDPMNRRARVQPGVVNAELSRATAPFGLCYAPDPSSQSACTLGGNVAENSGGPHCLKYGVTSRYVTGLVVVLPQGDVVELGRGSREPSGLDLVGLFVGSEGCYGLATEIEVGLVPIPPGVRTLLGIFREVEEAGAAVTEIMARGLLPAALEIIDGETIRAVESSVFAAGYPTDAGAALVVEFDGMEAGLDADVEEARNACQGAGAREVRLASGSQEREALWRGRKKAFGAMGRIAPDLMVQDATVPRSQLSAVLRRIGEIGREYDLTVANVFHAGDGNLHPNLLFDRRDPDQLRRVEAASSAIMDVCVEAGGTITGEHGVGLDKRRYMSRVISPEVMATMAGIRQVFDPAGLSNPGKVMPDGVNPFRFSPAGLPLGGAPGERLRELGFVPTPADTLPEPFQAALDGFPNGRIPPVFSPESTQAAADVLGEATREGWKVGFVGTGSSGLPSGAELLIHTGGMTGGTQHQGEDLTLATPAGASLGEVENALRGTGQWLPLGLPRLGSIGGALARGWGGGLESLYGAPRELVLGLTLVTGDGRTLEVGGRVLKNVAGFDLVRAVVGSRGVLGLMTQATLRLYPVPQQDVLLRVTVSGADEAWEVAGAVRCLPVPLAALEVVGPEGGVTSAEGGGGVPGAWQVVVRVHGRREEVDEILASVKGALGRRESVAVSREGASAEVERLLGWEARAPLLLRLKDTPGRLSTLMARVPKLISGLGPLRVAAHGLRGVVRVAPLGPLAAIPPAAALDLLGRLRREIQGEGGSLVAVRRPAAWALPREVGGDGGTAAPSVLRLEDSVRQVFDPAGILLSRERNL
ncbi:MAG: FAD-linked oxidase C-terminal domain-containing protein [Gemmatimonadota bacterium]